MKWLHVHLSVLYISDRCRDRGLKAVWQVWPMLVLVNQLIFIYLISNLFLLIKTKQNGVTNMTWAWLWPLRNIFSSRCRVFHEHCQEIVAQQQWCRPVCVCTIVVNKETAIQMYFRDTVQQSSINPAFLSILGNKQLAAWHWKMALDVGTIPGILGRMVLYGPGELTSLKSLCISCYRIKLDFGCPAWV